MNCNFRHRSQLIERGIVEWLPVCHGYVHLKLLQINRRPTTNMSSKSPTQPFPQQQKKIIQSHKHKANKVNGMCTTRATKAVNIYVLFRICLTL